MEILFIAHYTELLGANRSLLTLIEYLQSQEVSMTVVAPNVGDLTARLHEMKVPVIVSAVPSQFVQPSGRPSRRHPIARVRWWWNTRQNAQKASREAAHALREEIKVRPDLIYSNSTATRMGVELACELSVPHVWHLREFPENYNLEYAGGLPEFHRLAKRSARCIAISNAVRDKFFKGFQGDNICEVVYNGVASDAEIAQFESVPAPPRSEMFRCLLLGHVFQSKGHDLAVSALADLIRTRRLSPDQVQLRIVGPGDIPWVRRLTKEFGICEYVESNGQIENPLPEIQRADCLLMCSKYEAFGRVTAEAMAVGTPVIAANDNAGSAELVVNRVNGILCEPNAHCLAQSIGELMDTPELARQLRAEAFTAARKKFSTEVYGLRIHTILTEVLAPPVAEPEYS